MFYFSAIIRKFRPIFSNNTVMKPFFLFFTHYFLTFLVLLCFFSFSAHASKNPPPHVRLVDIWAYGDIVTDSVVLATEQNNLRFYFTTVEEQRVDTVFYQYCLEFLFFLLTFAASTIVNNPLKPISKLSAKL